MANWIAALIIFFTLKLKWWIWPKIKQKKVIIIIINKKCYFPPILKHYLNGKCWKWNVIVFIVHLLQEHDFRNQNDPTVVGENKEETGAGPGSNAWTFLLVNGWEMCWNILGGGPDPRSCTYKICNTRAKVWNMGPHPDLFRFWHRVPSVFCFVFFFCLCKHSDFSRCCREVLKGSVLQFKYNHPEQTSHSKCSRKYSSI